MKCDLCAKTTDDRFRMMPLCGDCRDKVKETRRKRREPKTVVPPPAL